MRALARVRFAGFRFLGVAFVAATMLVGVAVPVGATAPTKVSAADCEALSNVGDNIDGGGSGVFGKRAREISDGLDETASQIQDRKVRRALQTMADFFDELAGVNSVVDAGQITVREGKRYAKAVKVFSKAQFSCLSTQVTVPSGVTLPSGVTIPTIPR